MKPDESQRVYEGTQISVDVERWDRRQREIVRHPGAVAIVAMAADGLVTLVRQLREPARKRLLELPAGTCEDRGIRPGDKLVLDEDGVNGAEENASVLLLLRNGDESQVVVGHGPLSAAGRTISAMEELDVGVSAVVVRDAEG